MNKERKLGRKQSQVSDKTGKDITRHFMATQRGVEESQQAGDMLEAHIHFNGIGPKQTKTIHLFFKKDDVQATKRKCYKH